MVIQAPAKLNLYLKVTGRRADGFHTLDSLFHTIGLFDTLTLTDRADDRVRFSCSVAAFEGADNLVVRAARLMGGRAPGRGVTVHLEKQIPAGAGLGGGSSDAAATLMALNTLWGVGLTVAELAEAGAELGSDVPFFVYGGAAHVTGRGERVNPLETTVSGWCVLIFPGCHVGTPAVFRGLGLERGQQRLTERPFDSIMTSADTGLQDGFWAELGNDLESAAREIAPEIGAALEALARAGGKRARMSGSGSAVFCLAPTRAEAESIRQRLNVADQWSVWVVPLLARP